MPITLPGRRAVKTLLALTLGLTSVTVLPATSAQAECSSIPPTRDIAVTRTVHQTGVGLGVSDKVMLAGFEAGWVESRMNNLPCGDKDSLGVFQQRPSQGWGTPEQIMNVTYASTQFFTRAVASERRNPGFAAWQIAQDVQRSCCPDRYAAAEGTALSLIAEVRISRFVFVNSGGQVFAKDGAFADWGSAITDPGVSKVVLSGNQIGILRGGDFVAKQGISGEWKTIATDSVIKDIAIHGDRYAFVAADGRVHVKDGRDSQWPGPINAGGATKVVLNGGWIGVLTDDAFLAKFGINGEWKTMASGAGIKDIAISGDRFAFVADDGRVYVKDGADSAWPNPINAGGATRVVLKADWIAVLQSGNFEVKLGIFGHWTPLASGGQVTDIALGTGSWFAFVGSGDFFAKQGRDSNWLPMTGTSGQVTTIALET